MPLRTLCLLLLVLAASGCDSTTIDEDQSLCAAVHCSAGACAVRSGVAACECSALEQAQGLTCETELNDDSLATAVELQPSAQGHASSISPRADGTEDVDVYVFQAQANHYYRVRCVPGTMAECSVQVRDPQGIPTPTSNSPTSLEGQELEATATARYAVWVSGGTQRRTGTYTLYLEDAGADLEGDEAGSARLLPPGSEVDGALQGEHDVDWFAFEALGGKAYLLAQPEQSALGVEVYLGGFLQSVAANAQGELSFFAPQPGRYTVRYAARSPGVGVRPYRLKLEDLGYDDHPSAPSLATQLTPSSVPFTGRLQTVSDVDAFCFSGQLESYHAVQCTLEGGASCSARVVDPYGSTTRLFQPTPDVVRTGEQDGTFCVEVTAEGVRAGTPYGLRVERLARDDHPNPTSSFFHPLVEGSNAGVIEVVGDQDAFSFSATGGQGYRLRCDGCTFTYRGTELQQSTPIAEATLQPGSTQSVLVTVSRATPGSYQLLREELPAG